MLDTIEFGSFKTETYFEDLLKKVENGVIIHITGNCHSVAVL